LVFIISLDGARGTDFDFGNQSYVIMAFNPISYPLVVQALSRGSRKADKVCEGYILYSKKWANKYFKSFTFETTYKTLKTKFEVGN